MIGLNLHHISLIASLPLFVTVIIFVQLLIDLFVRFQMRPSQFLFDVSLDTEKKLASQQTVKIPKPIELLDMSESSYHKVE